MKYTLCFMYILFVMTGQTKAQQDSARNDFFFQSSVSEVLKIPTKTSTVLEIASASGKVEKIFEAPVAASVLTREEIVQSGALSIVEALRLLPAILVRETSSGNYDIHLRGFNNTPPGSDLYSADNSNTLVMIDNRPVFNYFSGGTFWEALPIDINDIDRIEVVRGPASALYGSNAVTGVINIITRKMKKEGFYSAGNLEYGSFNTLRASASGGYAPNNKLQLLGSFNVIQKNRTTDKFYSFRDTRFLNPLTDDIGIRSYQTSNFIKGREDVIRKYPQLERAVNKTAMNIFAQYQPNQRVSLAIGMGLEDSYSVRPFAENGFTPHSAMVSQTKYIDLKSKWKEGNLQFSYLFGKQTPGIESIGAGFDLDIIDLQADYTFYVGKLSLKPALNYKMAQYDDTQFFSSVNTDEETGVLNGRRNIDVISPALRLEYQTNLFRLIAAGRAENFIIQDNQGTLFNSNPIDETYTYFNYQIAATYKIQEKHFLRAAYSQANRGAFFTEVFTNWRDVRSPVQPGIVLQSIAIGNPALKLRTSRSLDMGYRFQISEKLFFDLDVFQANAQDYTAAVLDIDTIFSTTEVLLNPTFTQTNIPAKVRQQGLSFSLSFKPTPRLQTRFFLTLQKTNIQDFSSSNLDPELDPTGTNNYLALKDLDNYKGTPSFYGGWMLNYFTSKWNFNLSGYFFDNQELTHISDASLGREPNVAFVKSKLLVNLKMAYKPFTNISIYANLRNMLGQDSFEYLFTDRVGTIISMGFAYEF